MTLTSSIPVLHCADYPAARAFWTDILGFTVGEEGGTPPRSGIFHSGKAVVFVDAWHGPDPIPHTGWRSYFHCDDVDALAADLAARGYPAKDSRNTVYGMRELTLCDSDGNLLCLGQDVT